MRKMILLMGIAALGMTAPTMAAAQGKSGGKASHGQGHKASKGKHSQQTYAARGSRADRNLRGERAERAQRGYVANRCPPGLAKKNNGCLPPGIAKKGFATGDRLPVAYRTNNIPSLFGDRYRDSATSLYRYNDGNVYRVDPTTRRILEVISGR